MNKLILYLLWLLDAHNSLVTNVRVVRATSLDPLITALHRTSEHQQTEGSLWQLNLYRTINAFGSGHSSSLSVFRLLTLPTIVDRNNIRSIIMQTDMYAHKKTPTKPCKDTVHALTDLCVISLYLLQIWYINETLLVVDDVLWYSQQVWVVCCVIVYDVFLLVLLMEIFIQREDYPRFCRNCILT